MLEFVHPVEQMEMKIDKLVLCEPANTVVSLTRGGLGFWSMETGALEYRIADTTGGIGFYYVLGHRELKLDGGNFVTTDKLGDKERFDKEQIGVKEPFHVTKGQFTSKG